jgi:hypothetical protein
MSSLHVADKVLKRGSRGDPDARLPRQVPSPVRLHRSIDSLQKLYKDAHRPTLIFYTNPAYIEIVNRIVASARADTKSISG